MGASADSDFRLRKEEGIVVITFQINHVLLSTMLRLAEAVRAFDPGPVVLLVDMVAVNSMSEEVLRFIFSRDSDPYVKAFAVVVLPNSPASTINEYYLRTFRPQRPLRIFHNTGDAVNWLAQYLEPPA